MGIRVAARSQMREAGGLLTGNAPSGAEGTGEPISALGAYGTLDVSAASGTGKLDDAGQVRRAALRCMQSARASRQRAAQESHSIDKNQGREVVVDIDECAHRAVRRSAMCRD